MNDVYELVGIRGSEFHGLRWQAGEGTNLYLTYEDDILRA